MLTFGIALLGTNLVVAWLFNNLGKSTGYGKGYESGVIVTAIQAGKEIGAICDMCSESTQTEFLEKMGEWRKSKETK